jgi:hypothetical protein
MGRSRRLRGIAVLSAAALATLTSLAPVNADEVCIECGTTFIPSPFLKAAPVLFKLDLPGDSREVMHKWGGLEAFDSLSKLEFPGLSDVPFIKFSGE